jgi:hypothetical protein
MHTSATESSPEREWEGHEHISSEAEIEAQKLVNVAGSVALAKQAIDRTIEPASAYSREQFAEQMGFASLPEMLAASTPLSDQSGQSWYVTPDETGRWVVWNERELIRSQPFSTVNEAIASIQGRR